MTNLAYSYARASQDRTGEELSVTRQHEDQRDLAARSQLEVIEKITDNDVSAAGKRRRPGFEQMLTGIKAGKASAVISTDMSRLTRGKARDELRLLELGVEVGLTLYFVRAPDLDLSTAAGRLTASVLIAAARHEIEQKSERQKRANEQAAQLGRRVGGARPFGYEPDGITVREVEADAIGQAYGDLLAGVPLGRIAREWNEQGLLTPQRTRSGEPSRWRSQTVRVTLLNPRYAGLRVVGRRDGRVRGEIIGKAAWPALVTEERWRAAEAILLDRSVGARPRAREDRVLLTGLALCGIEGCNGTAEVNHNRHGQQIYRCRATNGHMSRLVEPVNEYVSLVVITRLSKPDAGELLVDHGRDDIEALHSEAQTYRLRLNQLALEFADGDLTPSQLRTATGRLREQLSAVEAKLADVGRVDVLGPMIAVDGGRVAWHDLSQEKREALVRSRWKSRDNDRKRAVIDVLMTVTLLPVGRGARTFRTETVQIDWKTA